MKLAILSGLFVVPFLVSCSGVRTVVSAPQPKEVILDTISVSAANNPIDIYRATETRYWDILHTKAALSFDLNARTASGQAWIRLTPYNNPMDSLFLDAKSMSVRQVTARQHNSELRTSWRYEEDLLKIAFSTPLRREDTIEVFVDYLAQPYAAPAGGSAAIRDDRGLYFINTDKRIKTKPAQIWTQGETEANSHWLPTLDQPNERFTMRLELTVPDSFVTLSNGSLDVSLKAGNGLRKDVWVMNKTVQPYAYMMAIGNFVKVEDSSWRNREISYYVEPPFAPYAKHMFRHTPEMVEYFSRVTGVPYPWNKYSQVVVRDYVSGAMENTTASLFGEFMNQNAREVADKNYEDVVSHELFHQWFGDYVTTESWSNLTVNESFANYGEQLWRNYKYGHASADELAAEDLARYLNQTQYNDEPLVRFHYASREDMFDRISYQKGGAILRYMHGLVGDAAFSRAMQLYLTKNALQPAEAHNWRMAVEEATGQDWNWFFNQWYFRGGHPELDLNYEYDDDRQTLTVQVRQTGPDSNFRYRLPLKAALVYDSEKQIVDWNIMKRNERFQYPYRNGVRPVFIPDYYFWLPGILREKKRPADWWAQIRSGERFMNKRRALTGVVGNQGDTATRNIFRAALKDSLEGIRYYALALMERMPDKFGWHDQFGGDVLMIAMHDPKNRVRAAAHSVLGSWKWKEGRAQLFEALADSSYMVAGAALNGISLFSGDTAYSLAKALGRNEPKAELESTIWRIIATRGQAGDIDYFREQRDKVYGTRKLSFAQYLYIYALSTRDDHSFEESLRMLTELAAGEGITSYRYNIGSKIAGLPAYLKEQQRSAEKEKATLAAARIEIANRYRELVIRQETDPANLKKYRSREDQ